MHVNKTSLPAQNITDRFNNLFQSTRRKIWHANEEYPTWQIYSPKIMERNKDKPQLRMLITIWLLSQEVLKEEPQTKAEQHAKQHQNGEFMGNAKLQPNTE